jgi:hypothetical protein
MQEILGENNSLPMDLATSARRDLFFCFLLAWALKVATCGAFPINEAISYCGFC